jgi:hypothetical protein
MEIYVHEELAATVLRARVPPLLAVAQDEEYVYMVFRRGGKPLAKACAGFDGAQRGRVGDAVIKTVLPLLARLHAEVRAWGQRLGRGWGWDLPCSLRWLPSFVEASKMVTAGGAL